jgi:hypothetical protein
MMNYKVEGNIFWDVMRAFWLMFTNVLEEGALSIFRVKE